MNMQLNRTVHMALQKGQQITLQENCACQVICEHGSLWITEEGDIKDSFLNDHDSLVVHDHCNALVSAMEASTVTFRIADFSGVRAAPARLFEDFLAAIRYDGAAHADELLI